MSVDSIHFIGAVSLGGVLHARLHVARRQRPDTRFSSVLLGRLEFGLFSGALGLGSEGDAGLHLTGVDLLRSLDLQVVSLLRRVGALQGKEQ